MLPQLPAPLFPWLLVRKLLLKQKPIPRWLMPKQTWKLLPKKLLLKQLLKLLTRLPTLLLQPLKKLLLLLLKLLLLSNQLLRSFSDLVRKTNWAVPQGAALFDS